MARQEVHFLPRQLSRIVTSMQIVTYFCLTGHINQKEQARVAKAVRESQQHIAGEQSSSDSDQSSQAGSDD